MPRNYQPGWDGNKTVGNGCRDVEGRWASISPHIPHGSRVLDLGAAQGYFAARAASELGCQVIAIDPDVVEYPGVTAIRQIVAPEDVDLLGTFDVALALSILHHIPRWRDMLDVLVANATTVIVETPQPDEKLKDAKKNARLQDIYDATRGTLLCKTGSIYNTHMRETVLL